MSTQDHETIVARLTSRSIPTALARDAGLCLPSPIQGLLLYGSRAREDHIPSSDLDLLALVPDELGSQSAGQANLSSYTPEQLSSASGTLFGEHLKRDGVFVFDPSLQLASIVAAFEPVDIDRLFDRVRRFAPLLVSEDVEQHIVGSVRLAKYLLRSAIYAESIRTERPCFSVREIADRYDEPTLVQLLDSNVESANGAKDLNEILRRLKALVGPIGENPFLTLSSLVDEEWNSDRERSTLGVLAMRRDQRHEKSPFDYSLLPKVLL